MIIKFFPNSFGGQFMTILNLFYLCFSRVNMSDHKLVTESIHIVTQSQRFPVKTATFLLFKIIKIAWNRYI